MKAGLLSERVMLLRKSVTQDAYGQPTTIWAAYKNTWASANELRTREFVEAAGRQFEITSKFTMRYTDDFTYQDRIEWRGQQYEPAQIITLGRKHGLEVLAKRIDQNERDT